MPAETPKDSQGGRLRRDGVLEVGRTYAWDRTEGALSRLFHRHLRPSLNEYYLASTLQDLDPVPLLARALGASPSAVSTEVAEAEGIIGQLGTTAAGRLNYPEISRMTVSESRLVYSLVRQTKPEVILETGVANGQSTAVILEALRRNGRGRLFSVDLSRDVGHLVPDELRSSWHLEVIPRRAVRQGFGAYVHTLPPIDLFIHDSDHSYPGQWREYASAWAHLSPRGILASDDIDWSYAFLDFAKSVNRRPYVLVTERKAFGFLARSA